ncbi:hypothetical protein QTP86_033500, partial [Hemibagrus guttatus]
MKRREEDMKRREEDMKRREEKRREEDMKRRVLSLEYVLDRALCENNTATPAALSSAYAFSHSPRESGRGGGTVSVTSPINLFIIVIYRPPGPLGDFMEEMDTLLSVFPSDSTPLTVLGDFNLPSDKLQSSGLLALLNSLSLSFNSCPPTHKGGNVLDLVFTHPSPATNMTATPLHIFNHHLVSFTIILPVLPKSAEEVLQIIRSCNPTTCPLDPIPSTMLHTISPVLLPFITTVINGSLTSGHVPTAFKKARVIPILKKPALDPSDISNYRPNNLHDPNQFGFKATHSTKTALLAVAEKLHAARSAKLSSVLILLDLSAAFDTVNHKTLLSTLRSLGICGTAWEWFASYLDGCSYQ